MTQNSELATIWRNGLWAQNTGLVALLGLCPLLAVSNTAVNALGLGIATVLVLTLTNTVISAVRQWIPTQIRIPAYVLIIASTVTMVELLMNAWVHDLYLILGLFIPLIVTNCAIMGRAEGFAARNSVLHASVDGLATGLGFLIVLFVIGAGRELIGQGTLFANAANLLGDWAKPFEITVIENYRGFLPAILPLGAFVLLALLIALKNYLQAHAASQTPQVNSEPIRPTS